MKNNGLMRKLMLMVFFSIVGSYCIGSDADHKNIQATSFNGALQLTYGVVSSVGIYCHKLWSDAMHHLVAMFDYDKNETVKIQSVEDNVHGNNYYCTDGKDDCIFNEEFFNDTWMTTGQVDEDPTTHLDVDTDPMEWVAS